MDEESAVWDLECDLSDFRNRNPGGLKKSWLWAIEESPGLRNEQWFGDGFTLLKLLKKKIILTPVKEQWGQLHSGWLLQ